MKNISIKLKLIILIGLSLLILASTLGIVSINQMKETLIESKYSQLTSVRDSKIKQLEDIFKLYKKQIYLLTKTSFSKDLTKEFLAVQEELDIDPYSKFPVNNKKVKELLPKWDAFYKSYTDTYPFDDVYVISAESGHVLYTFGKRNDFGANLANGEFRKSGLAKIWQKVKKYKRVVFYDMSAYEPRNGEPSMFIAAPVYIKDQFKSVLVYKIDNENIQAIMKYRSGYVSSHEDYLVGDDLHMRSDSFLSPKTHSLENSLKYPQSGRVDTIAAKEALRGNTGTKVITDYLGNKVLSSYTNFDIDEELRWAVISEINLEDILKKPNELRNTMIIITLVSFLIIMILLYLVIQKYIINSLSSFQDGLLNFFKFLNQETHEVKLLNSDSNDEIGIMSNAVNKGIEKTRENIEKSDIEAWIKDGVTQLNQILMNLKSVNDVSNESIKFISNYINAGVGVFYFYEEDKQKLQQYASYAHVIRDELSTSFDLKQGVIGQVAFQKEAILLKNIKKDENLITTGTVTQASYNTYTFPLIYNDELFGVIELGSFNEFNKQTLEFLSNITKAICISLATSIQANKVQKLLENTKVANDRLEKQQLELQEANAQMEEQQVQLEEANANMEEQQQQLEEANANMEEQQQQLKISEQNLKLQNQQLEETKKEIEKKADELTKSGKYKSEFLANMSHELRTPLNSIILLSSLLQKNSKKSLNNDDIKKAKTIFDSGNDLLRLINDILDLSKVESGKMEVIVDNFSSKDLLSHLKDTFDFTANDKGLEFNVIDEYNSIIHNDKDRILQILRNLISNAFKFTKEGSITVKIEPSSDLSQEFRINVIDTGIGIPLNKQEDIFKAFTQADGGTSRQYGGTGLGLSISRELAKLLGGYISLESKEEKGSNFSIDLPNLESVNSTKSVFEDEGSFKLQSNEKTKKDLTNNSKKVANDDRNIINTNDEAYLVIDDDEAFADIVYEEIKKDNNFVLVAYDGASGLDLIKNYNIKGVLLDLTLPDMDGIDVLKQLKSQAHTKNIPVHIISSKDKNKETLELGAIGYLQKPVYDGDINSVISSIDSFQEKKIKDLLIVEDDEVQREALIELVGEGVNIKGVKTASQAIEEVKKELYDTVVVDLGLMDGSGYEVCEFIKNNHPNLPIIIYTGRDISYEDKIKLQEYSNSIIIKTANSNERILNEINLFLHREEEPEESNNEIFDAIDLKDTNILIVDDDIKNIFVLDAALKEFEANTFTAFNGQEAIEFLKQNDKVDLILMDIMMPVMDGYEAMERIREDDSLKHIPIIAVTAKAMKEDREKCISLGADDYMSKPIDLNILGNLIKVWSTKKHR
ncbi:response regulator [Arcobacter roscoffensis]|uniref:histidine kinase n=1 Tax=Arcobacter roscoffensis TaxID=2961520 RepID=A0ABY5EAX6_9BACT|nr:response regulator [Arcobacter roscoffensis]UTJ07868.1 response regulator [Arcobacter roscoffensis]